MQDVIHPHFDQPEVRQWTVRSFRDRDSEQVKRLAQQGLLPGYVPIDAHELDAIHQLYLESARGHFWVAEATGQLLGTVALKEMDQHVGQLRSSAFARACLLPSRIAAYQ
jgi:hypothetical protein